MVRCNSFNYFFIVIYFSKNNKTMSSKYGLTKDSRGFEWTKNNNTNKTAYLLDSSLFLDIILHGQWIMNLLPSPGSHNQHVDVS